MSRRSRREQQRVTKRHHVRSLPQATRQSDSQARATRLLPPKVVESAYAEKRAGATIPEILAARWQEWGCRSKTEAGLLLTRAFKERGWETRGRPETTGISKARAPKRSRGRKLTDAEIARRQLERDAEVQRAMLDPTLGPLVREQAKDARAMRIPSRPWLISLEEVLGDDDEAYAERLAVAIARKRGDFKPEASWVEPLIARIDDLRERCAA